MVTELISGKQAASNHSSDCVLCCVVSYIKKLHSYSTHASATAVELPSRHSTGAIWVLKWGLSWVLLLTCVSIQVIWLSSVWSRLQLQRPELIERISPMFRPLRVSNYLTVQWHWEQSFHTKHDVRAIFYSFYPPGRLKGLTPSVTQDWCQELQVHVSLTTLIKELSRIVQKYDNVAVPLERKYCN